jgi:hypothetical protein
VQFREITTVRSDKHTKHITALGVKNKAFLMVRQVVLTVTVLYMYIVNGFPLLGNDSINKFPRRQMLGKQPVAG